MVWHGEVTASPEFLMVTWRIGDCLNMIRLAAERIKMQLYG